MALTWQANGAVKQFAAATSAVVGVPAGSVDNDLLLVVFGFESVAAGSGPWVTGTPQVGWSRVLYQAPAGTGSGLEVWQANFDFGSSTTFNFDAARTGVAREAGYRCGNGISAVAYTTATQTHTGDNTAFPSVTTLTNLEQVFICAAQSLAAPGYGTIAPYVQAFDNARAGFGTVEITLHDVTQASAGASGGATATDTASPAGSEGATGAFAATCGDALPHLLPILGVGA